MSLHSPTAMFCVPPQQQLCRVVSQGRRKCCSLLALLSIPSLAQTGQTGEILLNSRPSGREIEGGAGRQQTKRLMTQKKEAKQGAEHGSLGAIHPPGGVSSLRESTPVKHHFSSVYARLSLPVSLIIARASLSQNSPNVQFLPGAARGRTGLALMLSRQVSPDGTAAPPGE